MASDPLMIDLRKTVADGERLRMHLLDVQRRADRRAFGAAVTELVMFYGQGFHTVHRALSTRIEPGSTASHVLHEAVLGMAMHRLWMLSNTRIDAPEQIGRMALHWEQIVAQVLADH